MMLAPLAINVASVVFRGRTGIRSVAHLRRIPIIVERSIYCSVLYPFLRDSNVSFRFVNVVTVWVTMGGVVGEGCVFGGVFISCLREDRTRRDLLIPVVRIGKSVPVVSTLRMNVGGSNYRFYVFLVVHRPMGRDYVANGTRGFAIRTFCIAANFKEIRAFRKTSQREIITGHGVTANIVMEGSVFRLQAAIYDGNPSYPHVTCN